ncbi:DUF1461 domain-containing protein [Sedimenticola sp.]|uniref:lipoprotein intramolecular transacylase Lit n=1 Tax=Sedimenticola sp. TaxID=1940285 RepID=UPI003D11575D
MAVKGVTESLWRGTLIACLLWLAVGCAWGFLSLVNFGYPLIYEWIDIDQTIATYAPLNRYKKGLDPSDRSEHQRLFGAIASAINHGGRGLSDISYRHTATGQPSALLREAEIQHLQDVAQLVTAFRWSCYVALLLLLYLAFSRRCTISPPRVARALAATLGTLLILGGLIWLTGAERLFYALHELAFREHQWFFYYRDSYMTTLMQAPNLFAWIAAFIAGLAALLFTVGLIGWNRICRRAVHTG